MMTLTIPQAGIWQLNGELSFDALSQEVQSLNTKRPLSGEWCIRLAGLHRIDSAGIAYLLDCVRYAQSNNLKLKLTEFPSRARDLAEVQGVMNLLLPFIG